MNPYFIVFQFDSFFQLLSAIGLICVLISSFHFIKLNKLQKEKMQKLDKLIKDLEQIKIKTMEENNL